MSLTNPNTPVSQQDLKDLYEQKILPYIGGAFGLVATGIDSANLYSTTERVIGQWIDGKPIYQKTIYLGNFPNNTRVDVNHGIANIDQIVSIEGFLKYSNENFYPLTHFNYDGSNNYLSGIWLTKTKIKLVTNWNASAYDGYAILKYTKTTDSAVESYGTDTTYSTDEHVVGSWIDGKPLYQKTINFGTLPNNSQKEVSHNISNLKRVIDIRGYFYGGNVIGAPLPYPPNVPQSNNGLELWASSSKVLIRSNVDMSVFTECYVTLKYTKTS